MSEKIEPRIEKSLDDKLSEIWSNLNQESELRERVLKSAYAVYGQLCMEDASKEKIAEQKEYCLLVKGNAEGWKAASNLLNSLISELLKSEEKKEAS